MVNKLLDAATFLYVIDNLVSPNSKLMSWTRSWQKQ